MSIVFSPGNHDLSLVSHRLTYKTGVKSDWIFKVFRTRKLAYEKLIHQCKESKHLNTHKRISAEMMWEDVQISKKVKEYKIKCEALNFFPPL